MNGILFILKTLKNEGQIAILTGFIAFGISELFVPGATAAAVAFGLAAAMAAGGLDTLYFHLLFLLRRAPAHAAEQRYQHAIDDAKRRLADGSIRLREALIGRFEADFRRSIDTTRGESSHSKRQLKEARKRLKARMWTIERVIPAEQLVAGTAEAKSNPDLLERWTEYADGMVDAYLQVRRRQNVFAGMFNAMRPAHVARRTLLEWRGFSNAT
jgi:uncharacterized membrane protein YraQ (UPF0718 family)